MVPAILGAAAPIALAGKALNTISTIASNAQERSFQSSVDKLSAQLEELGIHGDGAARAISGAAKTFELHDGAPLPPPPPVSQGPIAPSVEGIHRLYHEMRSLR